MVVVLAADAVLHSAELTGLLLRLLLALLELFFAYLLYSRYRFAVLRALMLVLGFGGLALLDFWAALDRFMFLTGSWFPPEALETVALGARVFSAFLVVLGMLVLGLASKKLEKLEEG